MAEAAKWYVLHTYSAYENTVKATIEKTVESRNLQDQILAISIPTETVTEITETGASKTYERKIYPGYVLVKMVYSDDTWHVIKNIRGVTGFVGTSSNDPIPLSEDEVYARAWKRRRSLFPTMSAIPSASWMVPCPPSPARSRPSRSKRTRSALSSPCSAARLPSSSSSIRWKSFPSKRIGLIRQSLRGRGAPMPRKNCVHRITTTSFMEVL